MSDGPTPIEKENYYVRLLVVVPAHSPAEAVAAATEQIMTHGIRRWRYTVFPATDPDNEAYLDGWGNPLPLDDLGD